MSNFPTKTKIVTADQPFHKFDLSHTHLTSNAFFKVSIPLAYEVMPNSKFNIDFQNFVRVNPLVLPTMGKVKVHNKFFFVPFRTCWKPFLNFITQTPTQLFNDTGSSIIDVPTSTPVISNFTLTKFLKSFSTLVKNASTSEGYTYLYNNPGSYDYIFIDRESGRTYNFAYKLNSRGKFYLKLLNQLGYYPIFEQFEKDSAPIYYSALPLLAAGKLYYDYFENSAYIANEERLISLRKLLESRRLNLELDANDLENILELYLVMGYSSDSFVSAWDNPASPNVDNFVCSIPDNTVTPGLSAVSNPDKNNGAAYLTTELIQNARLSQNALNLLHQLSDQVHRRQVVGGREVDLFLSEYGIKPKDDGRSYYLNGNDFYINFNEVMSQSDTEGASLGAYAGKAAGYGNSPSFTFDSNGDFGMLFCVCYITPETAYCQGMKRHVLHKSRFDFFTPEYDSLGCQAISQGEVLSPMYWLPNYKRALRLGDLTDKVFGFIPRYADYKYINNTVTGDFMFASSGLELPAWHLARLFDPYYYFESGASGKDLYLDPYDNNKPLTPEEVESYTSDDTVSEFNIVHSRAFMWSYDEVTYNRIFYSDMDLDNFYSFYDFKISANMPCKSIFDDYDYDSAGREIVMSLNGSQIS